MLLFAEKVTTVPALHREINKHPNFHTTLLYSSLNEKYEGPSNCDLLLSAAMQGTRGPSILLYII